jgi:hypothetical protein
MAPLWVLVTGNGRNVLTRWAAGFRRRPAARAQVDNRLWMLRRRPLELLLSSGFVRRTDCPDIYLLSLGDSRRSVLLFCRGPLPDDKGFTLLAQGRESTDGLTQGLLKAACEGRDAILRDPEGRMQQYERLG